MKIDLMINLSEDEKLDKNLTSKISLNGELRESCDVEDPSILINIDNPSYYNYVYIPDFYRYYFIDSHEFVSDRLWRFNLSVDVLTTYKDDIRNSSAIISKQENSLYNKYYNDGSYDSTSESFSIIKEFSNPVFDENFAYIITAYSGYVESE